MVRGGSDHFKTTKIGGPGNFFGLIRWGAIKRGVKEEPNGLGIFHPDLKRWGTDWDWGGKLRLG